MCSRERLIPRVKQHTDISADWPWASVVEEDRGGVLSLVEEDDCRACQFPVFSHVISCADAVDF